MEDSSLLASLEGSASLSDAKEVEGGGQVQEGDTDAFADLTQDDGIPEKEEGDQGYSGP